MLQSAAAQAARSSSAVVCLNARSVSVQGCSAGELLKLGPRGAYTTGRTSQNCTAVFDFPLHASRLLSSARLIQAAGTARASEEPASPWHASNAFDSACVERMTAENITSALLSSLSAAVRTFRRENAWFVEARGEAKVTVLLVWGEAVTHAAETFQLLVSRHTPAPSSPPLASSPLSSTPSTAHAAAQAVALDPFAPDTDPGFCMLTHVCAMGPRASPPVVTQVRGAPRHNAMAKDSAWVTQRSSLEAVKPSHVDEILLADEATGCIFEGTQTNFFAVMEGTVYTAGTGILEGTVRHLVLEVCRKEGIAVVLEAPDVQHIGRWEGAFLTSTSRLVLPIDEIQYPAAFVQHAEAHAFIPHQHSSSGEPWTPMEAPDVSKAFLPSPLIARIEKLVEDAIPSYSTRLALA